MAPKVRTTTPADDKTRAVGDIRVSTQSQAEEGESLSTQRQQIVAHAALKGWELVKIYEDAGISGSKAENRPGFRELMTNCQENRNFQHLIITKLSRFARNTADFLTYSAMLREYGVEVVSIHENIDPSTHTGKLMLTLIAAIAEWEREVIREQMAENRKAKWKEHRTFIGKPPYGYRWNEKKGHPIPVR